MTFCILSAGMQSKRAGGQAMAPSTPPAYRLPHCHNRWRSDKATKEPAQNPLMSTLANRGKGSICKSCGFRRNTIRLRPSPNSTSSEVSSWVESSKGVAVVDVTGQYALFQRAPQPDEEVSSRPVGTIPGAGNSNCSHCPSHSTEEPKTPLGPQSNQNFEYKKSHNSYHKTLHKQKCAFPGIYDRLRIKTKLIIS